MHRCRLQREFKEGTWISDEMEEAYGRLAGAGLALSVESYIDKDLASKDVYENLKELKVTRR